MDTKDVAERPPEAETRAHRVGGFFAELPVLVLIAFALALLLKTFLIQAFYIPSESMVPTLEVGDRVLVNKVVYDVREPRRGEIVVFSQDNAVAEPSQPNPIARVFESLAAGLGLARPGERDFIKRIIGLPGDTLYMRDGVVYVNDQPLAEAPTSEGGYLSARDFSEFGPVEVPQGHYFVMGDNRPNSSDSRTLLGPIPEGQIIGRAFVIVWPVTRFEVLAPPDYGLSEAAVDLRPAA